MFTHIYSLPIYVRAYYSRYIKLIFFVHDLLYLSNENEKEKNCEEKIGSRGRTEAYIHTDTHAHKQTPTQTGSARSSGKFGDPHFFHRFSAPYEFHPVPFASDGMKAGIGFSISFLSLIYSLRHWMKQIMSKTLRHSGLGTLGGKKTNHIIFQTGAEGHSMSSSSYPHPWHVCCVHSWGLW